MSVTGLYRRFGVRLPDLADGWASTRCFTGRHEDRHPSARVHLRTGGFRCFTCNLGGGVLDALELLGLDRDQARTLAIDYGVLDPPRRRKRSPALPSVRHSRPAAPPPEPVPKPDESVARSGARNHWRIDYDKLVAGAPIVHDRNWVYIDAEGVPVGRVHRLDLADGTKRIWQERPGDGDTWMPGMNGAHLPLYRLPDVLEHARNGAQVVIVEGEKAVDALDRIGIFATTNPGGAGKWHNQHTHALQGATVVAISDCDLPGRLHTTQISISLTTNDVHVRAPVDLAPDRDDGFDIVDHLTEVADTCKAVNPNLSSMQIRASLHDHTRQLLNQPVIDQNWLIRRREYLNHTQNPGRRAYLHCKKCGHNRVHELIAGLAYCPCGAHQ